MTMQVTVNGQPHELRSGATIAEVVELLPGAPQGRGLAVAVDGEVVRRGAWESTALAAGARVEVVVAVQGG
jgi:sulfur carrier protein